MGNSVDLEEDFIQMPFVTGPSATSSQPGGIRFAKFVAPASDHLVAEQYASSGHQFFHITEVHTEPEVELNAARNDLLRKPMATVRAVRHSPQHAIRCKGERDNTQITLAPAQSLR